MASKEVADLTLRVLDGTEEFHLVAGVARDGGGNVTNHGNSRRSSLAALLTYITANIPAGGISQAFADGRYLQKALNLSDVASAVTARANLSVYSIAQVDALIAGAGAHAYEGFGNLLSLTTLTGIVGASANITLTDKTRAHMYDWTASGANTVQGAVKAAPATPWDLYLRVSHKAAFGVNTSFGLILRNSANGKLTTFITSFSAPAGIYVQQWTNPTTFASSLAGGFSFGYIPQVMWLRINNDGTNLNFYWSFDGIDWVLVSTTTIATFMGAVDQIGLGGVPQVAGGVWISDFGHTVPS
jgi:hypothetical protein